MARNMQPIVKRCRALGISPAVMGYTEKSKLGSTKRNPNAKKRTKKSEYATQLNEKQKVKFVYGIQEKQFRAYYEKAAKAQGITGEVLLTTIERRLDNVIFRLGLAKTRREARELVSHGHYTVNGSVVNIPSFLVKPGMVIGVKETSRSIERIKGFMEEDAFRGVPKWLSYDAKKGEGSVLAMPARDDIDFEVEEHLIVELYSK
ncbi:MAG: 30S ribosomal protein S4 [Oscillospiraceae bacterium]|jgi:small subunit ribosomal protein S4|nr:30S ribosomal protein S4 [Oscillospiraceae bacterium]